MSATLRHQHRQDNLHKVHNQSESRRPVDNREINLRPSSGSNQCLKIAAGTDFVLFIWFFSTLQTINIHKKKILGKNIYVEVVNGSDTRKSSKFKEVHRSLTQNNDNEIKQIKKVITPEVPRLMHCKHPVTLSTPRAGKTKDHLGFCKVWKWFPCFGSLLKGRSSKSVKRLQALSLLVPQGAPWKWLVWMMGFFICLKEWYWKNVGDHHY